jgi:protoheme IX farnesyltransferase
MNLIDSTSLTAVTPRALERGRLGLSFADVKALVKPRITVMVLLTVAIGFVSGAGGQPAWQPLLSALLGIGAVAAGASVLNQWLERRTDALMERTRQRPLPTGRLEPAAALVLGAALGLLGVIYLWFTVNALTAGLTALTLVSYVFVYTPLKRYTPWNTVVGAAPGALPPLLGYAAAAGTLDAVAWSLFGILFLWQFPHFWAIAWIYKDEYARAGLVMLPAVDAEGGRLTGRMMARTTLLLLLVSLLPAVLRVTGVVYFAAALALGGMFLGSALAFWREPSLERARQALWGSLVYLPVLLLVLMLDGPLGLFH